MTGALRFRPRSFARFIGDPLKAARKLPVGHREELARDRPRVLARDRLTLRER